MRTIEYICKQDGITPFSPQYAGVQGEDCSTQAVFTIDSAVDIEPAQGHSIVARVDCTDGAGAFYASAHLEIDSNRCVTFVIPHDITRAGGMCRANLVVSELDADNVEQRIVYSGTATLYFENSAQGMLPRNQYKRELSGLMEAAADAAEIAQEAAGQLSQHNADLTAHSTLFDRKENIANRITTEYAGATPATDQRYYTAAATEKRLSAQIATHNSESVGVHPYILQSIPAQIGVHNNSETAHADIRASITDLEQSVDTIFHNLVVGCNIKAGGTWTYDKSTGKTTVALSPDSATTTCYFPAQFPSGAQTAYVHFEDLPDGAKIDMRAWYSGADYYYFGRITADGVYQIDLSKFAGENGERTLLLETDSSKTFTFYITEKNDEKLSRMDDLANDLTLHNTSSDAHEDIRESISAFFHNIVTGCNVRMGGTWTYDKITGKTTVALSPDSATTTCYFPAQFPSGAQTAYVHFEDLPDGAKIDMRAWYSGADYYYFGRITADGVYQIDLSKFAGENGERTLLLETDSSKTFTFYITEKSDEALSENIRIGELEQNLSTTKAGVKILSNSMCAYSITHGVNLDNNGQEMSASNYSVLDGYIDIRNGVIFPYEKNIRWVWFYDEEFNAKERSEGVNNVTETQLSTYPYMRLSFLSTTIEGADVDLGTYSKVDILNRAFEMSQYRYLATAFGGRDGGTGMFILGSNDLRRFKCLNPMYPFHPGENEGIRDPSVMFIDGWYYVVYSNMQWISVTNELGLCRTKDFVTWEELPNLVVTPSNGDDLTNGYCWAPAFFREGDDCYIIVAGATDPSTQNFYHRIMSFDPDTATVSEAYTTNITFIDCHIYKENGMYYALGSQGALWKSDILLSDTWTKIENAQNPLYFIHYEGQFAIRKDDGNWRVFGQNVYNESDNVLDNLYYYQDGGSSLESDFEDRQVISYDAETLNFAESKWQGVTNKAIFSHFTIYDRNCWMDNNNRFA